MVEVLERTVPDEEEKPIVAAKPFYRRPGYIAVTCVLLLIGMIFGIRYYLYAVAHESTDDAFIDGHVIEISPKISGYISKVYVKDNQQVNAGDLLAEIDPRDAQAKLDQAQAALSAAEASHNSARSNVELTRATSGAVVQQAASSLSSAKAEAEAAAANVAAARGRLEQARAQVTAALASASQSKAEVAASEAEQTWETSELQRYKQLFERDEVSRQRLDQATAAADTAAARLNAARQKVATSEAEVGEARAAVTAAEAALRQAESQASGATAMIGEAEGKLTAANSAPQQVAVSQAKAENAGADIEEARAAVEQAQLQLSYAKIYAPVTGRITRKAIDTGAYVQPGGALMAVVPGEVWVTANFKETQLDRIRIGQSVDISVDAYSDKVFKGHVDSIQSGTGARFSMLPPENATGNYVKVVQRVPVKIVFDEQPDAGHLLAPGMSVVPEVKTR